MLVRNVLLVSVVMLAAAGCTQASGFLPLPDAGSAHQEAKAQNALSSRFTGDLGERLRQLREGRTSTDADRHARIRPVMERLYAAAAPFCRNQARQSGRTGSYACVHPVSIEDSGTLNAHANSRRITISPHMVDLAADDAQLALVLGHELAHVLLGHTRRNMWDQLAAAIDDQRDKNDERAADYLGIYLVARSGYDAWGAIELWRRMGAVQPAIIIGDRVHPGTAERYVALRRAAAEIDALRQAGQPLLPRQEAMRPG